LKVSRGIRGTVSLRTLRIPASTAICRRNRRTMFSADIESKKFRPPCSDRLGNRLKEGFKMPKSGRSGLPSGSGTGTGKGGPGGRRDRTGGTKPGLRLIGEWVCLSCGTTAPYATGIPCHHKKCPKCGAPMVRK
jgi:hypothetical protein